MRRWDDSAKMRQWIDVGARAHEIHAGGSLHHHSENIYQLLNEEMKREAYAGRLRLEYSEVEMNCYVESRDCFDSLICSVPVVIHFKWPGSAIWARVSPEGIRSRHYPLILAGKLNLRQLNTLNY
ncbi:hypothetical protein NC651_039175 [Populus alba x Populus x berolinensis]|nr:hypothetical protein NC651_039175 [Populus alba x Populus x berolinensis]